MNIDAMSSKRDMKFYVEAALAASQGSDRDETPSAIISSISFSSLLDNAIRVELLKDSEQP